MMEVGTGFGVLGMQSTSLSCWEPDITFFTKTQDLTLIFLSKFFELQSPVTLGFHSLVSRNRTRTDATINNLIPFDLKPYMLITHKYSEFFKAQFNLQSFCVCLYITTHPSNSTPA